MRIYISGYGLVSPLGINAQEHELALRQHHQSFTPITRFDVSRRIAKTAAQVNLPEDRLFFKTPLRRQHLIDRGTQMLFLSIQEAMARANIDSMASIDAWFIGTSAGAMSIGQEYFKAAIDNAKRANGQRLRLQYYQPHQQLQLIANEYSWTGRSTILSNACASGANAIGEALLQMQTGKIHRVIAGGYDAIAELVFAGFDTLKALAPSGIPRPFDRHRDGLALGEGAGVVILETETALIQRKGQAIAELSGYGTATDLHHLTQPNPEGLAAFRSMTQACQMAGFSAHEIQYINSHGTGTPYNDVSESSAISAWAGTAAKNIAVSSTKSVMGHLLGGAGAVEAALCVLNLEKQFIPANLNVREIDPAVTFDLVQSCRSIPLSTCLTNSFGFGGTNASLIFNQTERKRNPQTKIYSNSSFRQILGAAILSNHDQTLSEAPARPATTKTRLWKTPFKTIPKLDPASAHLPRHQRLRRASDITKYLFQVSLQAIENSDIAIQNLNPKRLGIIVLMFNGCVQYTSRFYQEVLSTPEHASPLLFPETVYNAPVSHLAAHLNAEGPVTTLLGESSQIHEALRIADSWFNADWIDHALILGAEEKDWLSSETGIYFHQKLVLSEGSAALLIGKNSQGNVINCAPSCRGFSNQTQQIQSIQKTLKSELQQLQQLNPYLISSLCNVPTLDHSEQQALNQLNLKSDYNLREKIGDSMGALGVQQLALAFQHTQQEQQPTLALLAGTIGTTCATLILPCPATD